MRSQTSSRRDDVSPLSNGQLYACSREKISRMFADSVGLFNGSKIVLSSLVCVLVCWCIGLCVHRRWSIERHRKSMDFGRGRGCGGPYLAALHNSARVQKRVEFVELARDMSSNCTGEVQARTGISRLYHSLVPPRTRFTCSMNILAGIFDCVRTHCDGLMAYHTWYLGAGITYVLHINIVNIHILIPA